MLTLEVPVSHKQQRQTKKGMKYIMLSFQVWVSCANIKLVADYTEADYEELEEAFQS